MWWAGMRVPDLNMFRCTCECHVLTPGGDQGEGSSCDGCKGGVLWDASSGCRVMGVCAYERLSLHLLVKVLEVGGAVCSWCARK